MTAKEYLSQLPRLRSCIKALQESYDQTQAMATSTTQRHDEIKVQSNGKDKQERLVLKMVDLSDKMDKVASKLIELQTEALNIIMQMSDPRERTVLIQRYINGKSWVYVTCEVYQTDVNDENIDSMIRHTHRIHASALKSFNECH